MGAVAEILSLGLITNEKSIPVILIHPSPLHFKELLFLILNSLPKRWRLQHIMDRQTLNTLLVTSKFRATTVSILPLLHFIGLSRYIFRISHHNPSQPKMFLSVHFWILDFSISCSPLQPWHQHLGGMSIVSAHLCIHSPYVHWWLVDIHALCDYASYLPPSHAHHSVQGRTKERDRLCVFYLSKTWQ